MSNPVVVPFSPKIVQLNKDKWKVRNHTELSRHVQAVEAEFIVDALLPQQQLILLAGNSGLGKSPLLYQLAACVAAGVPFLGLPTKQGRTVYLDYENGPDQVQGILSQIKRYLNISDSSYDPDNLLLWNYNDTTLHFGSDRYRAEDLIREMQPSLVIIDSLSAYDTAIEEKPTNATTAFQRLRKVMEATNAAVIATHHLTKADFEAGESLEDVENVRGWFKHVRGSSALINGSDVRLGSDQSSIAIAGANQEPEAALLIRGFRRVRGDIPHIYIARDYDENGEPFGYRRLTGLALLGVGTSRGDEYLRAYNQLPYDQVFRFKDIEQAVGRGADQANKFRIKALNAGVLRKVGVGYQKVQGGE